VVGVQVHKCATVKHKAMTHAVCLSLGIVRDRQGSSEGDCLQCQVRTHTSLTVIVIHSIDRVSLDAEICKNEGGRPITQQLSALSLLSCLFAGLLVAGR